MKTKELEMKTNEMNLPPNLLDGVSLHLLNQWQAGNMSRIRKTILTKEKTILHLNSMEKLGYNRNY